jgi:hypothetical protein
MDNNGVGTEDGYSSGEVENLYPDRKAGMNAIYSSERLCLCLTIAANVINYREAQTHVTENSLITDATRHSDRGRWVSQTKRGRSSGPCKIGCDSRKSGCRIVHGVGRSAEAG